MTLGGVVPPGGGASRSDRSQPMNGSIRSLGITLIGTNRSAPVFVFPAVVKPTPRPTFPLWLGARSSARAGRAASAAAAATIFIVVLIADLLSGYGSGGTLR